MSELPADTPKLPARTGRVGSATARRSAAGRRASSGAPAVVRSMTMRQLGKLTADDVAGLAQPVPVTSNGRPVAWLVPMTAAERRRAELVAAGRLRPGRPEGLRGWRALPARTDGVLLSEALADMREHEQQSRGPAR